jgi:ketosteroid isomerase-like protein
LSKEAVDRVREAYRLSRRGDPRELLNLIAPDATWQGAAGTKWKACENAEEIAKTLLWRTAVHRLHAVEFVDVGDHVVVGLAGTRMNRLGAPWYGFRIFQVIAVRDGRIAGIRDFGRRQEAFAAVGLTA